MGNSQFSFGLTGFNILKCEILCKNNKGYDVFPQLTFLKGLYCGITLKTYRVFTNLDSI